MKDNQFLKIRHQFDAIEFEIFEKGEEVKAANTDYSPLGFTSPDCFPSMYFEKPSKHATRKLMVWEFEKIITDGNFTVFIDDFQQRACAVLDNM